MVADVSYKELSCECAETTLNARHISNLIEVSSKKGIFRMLQSRQKSSGSLERPTSGVDLNVRL